MTAPYKISCHCGHIQLEVAAELSDVFDCNCSICSRSCAHCADCASAARRSARRFSSQAVKRLATLTSVPGLYAVGDVVKGLTQIGVAMGQAAVAASTINSSLERRLRPTDGRRSHDRG